MQRLTDILHFLLHHVAASTADPSIQRQALEHKADLGRVLEVLDKIAIATEVIAPLIPLPQAQLATVVAGAANKAIKAVLAPHGTLTPAQTDQIVKEAAGEMKAATTK